MMILLVLLAFTSFDATDAFLTSKNIRISHSRRYAVESPTQLEPNVAQLKKVLRREYISFFNPMERQYYREDVVFQDPLTELSGIDAYQNNVDMLSGRTWLGKILFSDASINLHSVEGGKVTLNGDKVEVSNIVTRWTLRFCFQALPWKPTARFSGISVYQVEAAGSEGIRIKQQNDYWDSINLQSDSSYVAADKSVGLKDFLDQLKPSDLEAPGAAPEVPYELLRRGNGYDVRRYPSFTAAKLQYERRDEGYGTLGSFTQGMNPMSPSILRVNESSKKTMMWPLTYGLPGQDPPAPQVKAESSVVETETIPSRVVAVGRFSDAIVEPAVRKATRLLRECLDRDGLTTDQDEDDLQFCQYDAIFSMGKRRSEVWLNLPEGSHPWSM